MKDSIYRANLSSEESQTLFRELFDRKSVEVGKSSGFPVDLSKRATCYVNPMKNQHQDKLVFSYMRTHTISKNNANRNFSYSATVTQDNKVFEKSRIFGLKEALTECPDILLQKDVFKKTYSSTYIPSTNYDVTLYANPIYVLKEFDPAFIAIFNQLIPAITNVFSKYGELTELESSSRYENYSRSYSIKNNLYFVLRVTTQVKYKIYNGDLVPDYVINLELMQEYPDKVVDYANSNAKNFMSIDLKQPKRIHLKFNVSYFAFLNKPNYYLQCLTPHGFIRLKKEYLHDFLKQVIFHYMFKKYFGISEIEVSMNDLENDPMSFFSLVEMMQL